jgi:hypothetical protein
MFQNANLDLDLSMHVNKKPYPWGVPVPLSLMLSFQEGRVPSSELYPAREDSFPTSLARRCGFYFLLPGFVVFTIFYI